MLDPEPRYNGKSLKAWLYQFDRNEKGP
ncbi:MAG: hypothetical protein JWO95_3242, partial [Verrucomicrobiales bacterium]|nr:hypothetical protein [Verrucomicrobiales bacterium]